MVSRRSRRVGRPTPPPLPPSRPLQPGTLASLDEEEMEDVENNVQVMLQQDCDEELPERQQQHQRQQTEEENDKDEVAMSSTTVATSSATASASASATLPKFESGQKVLARDNDGLLYIAFVRRSLHGQNQVQKLDLFRTIAHAEDDPDGSSSGGGGGGGGATTTTITTEDSHYGETATEHNNKKKKWFYFVHYLAWKVNWDRWVAEDDLLELTDEHLQWQSRILQEHRQLQQYFKQRMMTTQSSSTGNHKKRIDGGAFLKAWKPKLEGILQELKKGETSTTTITTTTTTSGGGRPTKKQKTSSSSSSSSSSGSRQKQQQQRQLQEERRRRQQQQVLEQERQLRLSQSLQQQSTTTSSSSSSFSLEQHSLTIPFGLKRILVEEWEILSDPKFGMVLDMDVVANNHNNNNNHDNNHHHGAISIMPSIQTILQEYLQSKGVAVAVTVEGPPTPVLSSSSTASAAEAAPDEQASVVKASSSSCRSTSDPTRTVREQPHPSGGETESTAAGTPMEVEQGNGTAIESKEAPKGDGGDHEETTTPATAADPAAATSATDPELDDLKVERQRQRDKEWKDMAQGIVQLFDQALPFRLLYPTEQSQLSVLLEQQQQQQQQQQESQKGGTAAVASLTELYGANHLVRLACQLPTLMEDCYFQKEKKKKKKTDNNANPGTEEDPPEEEDDDDGNNDDITNQEELKNLVKPILAKVNDLLRFLQKHQSRYFPQRFRKKNTAEVEWEQKVIKKYERKLKSSRQQQQEIEQEQNVGILPTSNDGGVAVGGEMMD